MLCIPQKLSPFSDLLLLFILCPALKCHSLHLYVKILHGQVQCFLVPEASFCLMIQKWTLSLLLALWQIIFIYMRMPLYAYVIFTIRAAFARRVYNFSWYLCFLELLLVGKSDLRSVRIQFRNKALWLKHLFMTWTGFLTYLNFLNSSLAKSHR